MLRQARRGRIIFGKATYKGAAAGNYALASADDDTYEGGHFTARATLTVDFDADDTSSGFTDNEGIALSGMIDNFMTGATARPDWMVRLMVDRSAGTRGTADFTKPGSGGGEDDRVVNGRRPDRHGHVGSQLVRRRGRRAPPGGDGHVQRPYRRRWQYGRRRRRPPAGCLRRQQGHGVAIQTGGRLRGTSR